MTLKPLQTLRSCREIVVDPPKIQSRVNSRAAVLVVEDESHLRTTMCAVLALRGFHPLPAQNVEVALRLLGTERVDAIVLDLRLPDPTGQRRSGLDLLRFVRATPEHAEIPVAVFTGMPLSASEEELVRSSRTRVLFKPQPYAVLCDHLNMMLEGRAPQ